MCTNSDYVDRLQACPKHVFVASASLDVDQQQQQQQLNVNIKGRSGLPLLDHRLSRVGRSEATKSDRLSVICALVKDTRTN